MPPQVVQQASCFLAPPRQMNSPVVDYALLSAGKEFFLFVLCQAEFLCEGIDRFPVCMLLAVSTESQKRKHDALEIRYGHVAVLSLKRTSTIVRRREPTLHRDRARHRYSVNRGQHVYYQDAGRIVPRQGSRKPFFKRRLRMPGLHCHRHGCPGVWRFREIREHNVEPGKASEGRPCSPCLPWSVLPSVRYRAKSPTWLAPAARRRLAGNTAARPYGHASPDS